MASDSCGSDTRSEPGDSAASAFSVGGQMLTGIGGKCLDVYGANSANSATVGIWTCHDGTNRSWTYTAEGTLVGLEGKHLRRQHAEDGGDVHSQPDDDPRRHQRRRARQDRLFDSGRAGDDARPPPRESDGTFYLVVWNERLSGSDAITVNLGASYDDATSGTDAVSSLGTVSQVPLTTDNRPYILAIK